MRKDFIRDLEAIVNDSPVMKLTGAQRKLYYAVLDGARLYTVPMDNRYYLKTDDRIVTVNWRTVEAVKKLGLLVPLPHAPGRDTCYKAV